MSKRRTCMFLLMWFVVFALCFLLIARNYYDPKLTDLSNGFQSIVYDSLGSVGLWVAKIITYMGQIDVMLPVTLLLVLYFIFKKRYALSLLLLLNLYIVRTFNQLLKDHYQVVRPTLEHLVSAGSWSFPSGHSMNSAAFYGFLAFLLSRWLKQKGKGTLAMWIGTGLLILLIGLSRIYLGVHFPIDVVGGFSAGLATLMLMLILYFLFVRPKSLESSH